MIRHICDDELPVLSIAVRVRTAILCTQAACVQPPEWGEWATAWLDGTDRSARAAVAAWAGGEAGAPWAARAAAWAAWAVEEAVEGRAEAVEEATRVAAWAVEEAVEGRAEAGMSPLDLDAIVRQAIEEEDA